ncbi:class I SAM-dependent methyltransferase [Bradyrhizobium sp. NP1]|uniref:class I SAM-dependent methyltransferase n=1 Tax=Bradyrhizobium sp. NP1 TaxID=3049772 RepID=UPI0025A6076F|nr:class I SAM-dependent methyltransferase [Bradyrhizobium sp. NP1]WJR80259.1 class I SAM-dependent methyltransferase [Bradyrhizobium sp. NP1]
MARFASTVALYEELRPPYPPEFFRAVAQQLELSRRHALIDLGTGPGLLALGFAPYVGRIVGVDPEPGMIAAARAAAARAGRDLTLIEGKAEALPAGIGAFDLVTIGRALHWMEREPTLAVLERLVAPGSAIAICGSSSASDGRNPWLDTYNAARNAWAPKAEDPRRGERLHKDLAAFFSGSAFRVADFIKVEGSHEIGVRDLARRVLTFSTSSPDMLGDRVEAMLDDVEQRMRPLSRDGVITEVFVATAQVARR